MAFAGDVLHQHDLAGTDHPCLTVACRDLHAAVKVDDVLPPRRRMPGQIIIARGLTEDDAVRRQTRGELAEIPFLHPLHLDIAPVRLALRITINVVYPHLALLPVLPVRLAL